MIKAIVNGAVAKLPQASTITDVLSLYKLNPERVVAEVNGNVLTKEEYSKTMVNEGDKIELISFVGGG